MFSKINTTIKNAIPKSQVPEIIAQEEGWGTDTNF